MSVTPICSWTVFNNATKLTVRDVLSEHPDVYFDAGFERQSAESLSCAYPTEVKGHVVTLSGHAAVAQFVSRDEQRRARELYQNAIQECEDVHANVKHWYEACDRKRSLLRHVEQQSAAQSQHLRRLEG